MSLSLGIVGLPNVGKSTLFNALTKSKQADAANYPFCTIEPNIGIVMVPDERLERLTTISASLKSVPTTIEFVDIAGLVKGASEGEGLGNKFLQHIREVDAIVQVVRSFSDANVTHVHNRVDPKDDADVINLELVLADWQTVSKRLDSTSKRARGSQAKEFALELSLLDRLSKHLQDGKFARDMEFIKDELEIVRDLHLITMKPMMYVVNTDEDGEEIIVYEGATHVYISAKTEAELAELNEEDRREFMQELGMDQSGLDKIIVAGYELLGLVTYFTSGVPESRAWTVKSGTLAPDAAGVIHTDFIKGFIKADVVKCADFVLAGGWGGVKSTGKMKLVGKDYEVLDGDVIYFHVAT